MADTSRRMLQLLSLLQTGRAWPGAELADRLGISARTLRRDVERLHALGYPTESRPGPGGHYRLVAGTAMPPLVLDDDEAIAIALSLRMSAHRLGDSDAAERARATLERVLPTRLRRQVEAVAAVTETVADPGAVIDPLVIGALAAAAADHRRVRFGYRDRRQQVSSRLVDPYRNVFQRGQWYLLGWDVERTDWRTFRLDRVVDVTTTDAVFVERELPAETAARYLADNLRRPRHQVSVVFAAPVDTVADRLVRRDGELTPIDEDHCRYVVGVDSFEWSAMVLALLGIPFRVESPAVFADFCREIGERFKDAAAAD